MNALSVTKLSVPVIEVELEPGTVVRYPCALFVHKLAINEIPAATVSIAAGVDLFGKGDSNPLQIIERLNDSSKHGVDALPRCTIIERDLVMFKGYICEAGLKLQPGGSYGDGRILVELSCLGPAARLLRVCSGAVTLISSSKLASAAAMQLRYGLQMQAGQSTSSFQGIKESLNSVAVTGYVGCMQSTRVVERFAYAVAIAKNAHYIADRVDFTELKPDSDVLDCIGGSLKTNPAAVSREAEVGYFRTLLNAMWASLDSSSIWDAVVRIATSDNYLLQLYPRISCDSDNDFKLELSTVFKTDDKPVAVVSNEDIVSSDVLQNPLNAINNPDVVIVTASASESLDLLQAWGVAATDEKQQEVLRSIIGRSGNGNTPDFGILSVYETGAPGWVQKVMTAQAVEAGRTVANAPGAVAETPATTKEVLTPGTTARTVPAGELTNPGGPVNTLLNACATAVLVNRFRQGMGLAVQLNPGLRYGLADGTRLEDCIGKTIDLDVSIKNSNVYSKLGTVRGVLSRLSYTCNASSTSSVVYNIRLAKARLIVDGKDAFSLDAALYTTGK